MKEFLNYELFSIGDYTLRTHNLFSVAIFVFIIIISLFISKRAIYHSKRLDRAKKYSVNKLLKYIIAVLSVLVCLYLLGINISVLLAGSAAILVGLGFGLQNLFNDFISGIILLLDSTLKVGDIIEVNNNIYRVLEINFRTTQVVGRDENYVILPNSELTANKVINWTHSEISSRFYVTVGVDYSTDVLLLMDILKDVPIKNERVLNEPKPFVRFMDYGDSALIFSIFFFTNEIFRVENIKSELRVEIFKALKAHNIKIPFPQRDIHIKTTIDGSHTKEA